ncbi:MAG: DUF2061 domain-containing protein [Candidatus Helarchaeota archaeon]
MDLKRSFLKSIIYRMISILTGFLIGYLLTGQALSAALVSIASEAIQFFNYFGYEVVWSYFDEKRIRKMIDEEYRAKEIKLKLSLESINTMAREFSQLDTFTPRIYKSVLNFYNMILENKELKELHGDFLKYKKIFQIKHEGRGFENSKKSEIQKK